MKKTTVGIICAGDDELAPFLPMITDCNISEKLCLNFYSGKIDETTVTALFFRSMQGKRSRCGSNTD